MLNILQKKNFLSSNLLLSFALAPLFGSLTLIITVYLLAISCFYFKTNDKDPQGEKPFIMLGWLLIAYFIGFVILETFHAPNVITQIKELGKIFPIFVVGVFALSINRTQYTFNYNSIGEAAVIGIYITVLIAFSLSIVGSYSHAFLKPLILEVGVESKLTMGSGNSIVFGTMLTTVSFLTLLGVAKKNVISQIITYGAFCLGLLTVVLWNMQRGPIVASVPLVLLALWYIIFPSTYKFSKKIKKFVISVLILMIIIFLFAFYTDIFDSQFQGLKTVLTGKNYDLSVTERLIMYSAVWDAILHKPLFGYGIVNRFLALTPYLGSFDGHKLTYGYSHVHNIFLNHLISAGLLGLFLLVMLILSPIIDLYQRGIKISCEAYYLALVIIISITFNGLTNIVIMHDLMGHFFGILILISGIAHYNSQKALEA